MGRGSAAKIDVPVRDTSKPKVMQKIDVSQSANGIVKDGVFYPSRGGLLGRASKTDLGMPGKRYPEEARYAAVAVWIKSGSLTVAAQETGVDINTVKYWRKQKFWHEIAEEILNEDALKKNARLYKIVDKAMDVVEDRLTNGNFQYDQRTGQVVRVPVQARDANSIMDSAFSRAHIIKKDQEAKVQVDQDDIKDRLSELASSFAAFVDKAKLPKKTDTIIEGEVVDVIEEQDEEN